MKLEDFGYNDKLNKLWIEDNLKEFEIGRVISEHKERYIVKTEKGDFEAEITGNLRFSAKSREDFPAVGDWVALITYDSEFSIIHKILPRFSIISRQAVGQFGDIQIIATNIDYALLVQAVNRDFNINRIERYLTICNASKVTPIIILNKIDLINDAELKRVINLVQERIKHIPVITTSCHSQQGIKKLKESLKKGNTYCLLGSSGVGKSTLLNYLSGKQLMKTNPISASSQKGKHVTSHRELIVIDNGSILIDNPGMREVGIADSGSGLERTFEKILEISQGCKFKDCTHISEAGCAVLQAVKDEEIDKDSYQNYLKMEKEKAHFESTVADRRKKDKIFGKMMKNYKKDKKSNKF